MTYITTNDCLEERETALKSMPAEELAKRTPLETNIFTFSRKPPADQWTTRIGGVPAWPSDLDWPECVECAEPMFAVCQLDFRESVLSDFVSGDALVFHYCFTCLPWSLNQPGSALNWFSDSGKALVTEEVTPDEMEGDEPGPCFGTANLTTDYKCDWEDRRGVFTTFASKIGGYPPTIQPISPPTDSAGNKMRFLGSLGSLEASRIPKVKNTPPVGDLMWDDFGYLGFLSFWGSRIGGNFETSWFITSGLDRKRLPTNSFNFWG